MPAEKSVLGAVEDVWCSSVCLRGGDTLLPDTCWPELERLTAGELDGCFAVGVGSPLRIEHRPLTHPAARGATTQAPAEPPVGAPWGISMTAVWVQQAAEPHVAGAEPSVERRRGADVEPEAADSLTGRVWAAEPWFRRPSPFDCRRQRSRSRSPCLRLRSVSSGSGSRSPGGWSRAPAGAGRRGRCWGTC